jgi:hypothetical protein
LIPCLLNWDNIAPTPMELESTVKINSRSKLTEVRLGLELSLLCNCSKAFWASSGRGPPFQALSFGVSFVRGQAVWAKLSMVLLKKELRPRNCLTCLTCFVWGPPILYGFCFYGPGPNAIIFANVIAKVINFFRC